VLPAFKVLGLDMQTESVRRAVRWLFDHQNDDGGWGESCVSYVDTAYRGRGPSTASQTAWALLALLAADEVHHFAVQAGLDYLTRTQLDDGSWDEPYFTGTGFPGYGIGQRLSDLVTENGDRHLSRELPAGFMINYHMYRNCWPLMALGRCRKLLTADPRPLSVSENDASGNGRGSALIRDAPALHRLSKS
jgi:squalene-hopene/tetraprenyl-beta-curcumene cyclase